MEPTRLVSQAWAAARENLGLKLIALLIAVVMFSLVRGEGTVHRSLDLPLTAALPPAAPGQPVLVSDLPDKVRLTVRGSPSIIGTMHPDEIGSVLIDLRRGRPTTVRLGSSLVHLPAGATFEGFVPDALQLQWDTYEARTLPVRPALVGRPESGTRLGRTLDTDPPRVRLLGPARAVDALLQVHTEPIVVTGLGLGRYVRSVALEPLRPGHRYDPVETVRVVFEVVPEVTERRFIRVPVTAVGGVGHAELRPPVVDVAVQGPPRVIDALATSQVVPRVELGPLQPLRGVAPAPVVVRDLPAGVGLVTVSPDHVLVVPAH